MIPRKQLNRQSAMKLRNTSAHSYLATCVSEFNRKLQWRIRKTAHQTKSKRTYCESSSTNNFSYNKQRRNLSIKSQLAQGENSPERNHKHKLLRKRSLKDNVSTLEKQATLNKNADQDSVTKTATMDAIKPQKRIEGKPRFNPKLV